MDTKEKKKEKKIQDELLESAHTVWLAGLGALATAGDEGSKLFKKLVERGKELEAKGKVEFGKAKEKVESRWEELEKKIDEKVATALHRFGVPTREEIRDLTRRVEELSAKLERLKPKGGSED